MQASNNLQAIILQANNLQAHHTQTNIVTTNKGMSAHEVLNE